jgi:quercetin dioxygenase-like cupin family protein
MNINDLHQDTRSVSTASLFKMAEGNVTSIRILGGEQLKEHITKVPALLICLNGEAIFENENGMNQSIKNGDYVNIDPQVKHWVTAKTTSNLILIK